MTDILPIIQMTFVELASVLISNRINAIEARTCPDQFVGKISSFRADQEDFPTRLPAHERPSGIKCLVMIIESPHVDEFIAHPSPAKRKTGKLIRTWIDRISDLSVYSDYGLILVNAIQNQCSLGAPTRCFRDDVFRAVWDNGGENAFINRLKFIYQEGDVLANCCTRGNSKEAELRQLVQLAIIKKTGIKCSVHRRTHPSSWHSKKNREYEWESKVA